MFHKNIAFTRILKAGGRPREFNFRRKKINEHFEYDVDTSDDRGERHYFTCYREDGTWHVHEKLLPQWVIEMLPQLPDILEASEKENA
ncbi:MAG: hypothetical protein JST87_18560 [Bacteroidetes bacterium]|nr:hypothetical protein [Bacteroidota bacterium]